MMMGIDYRQVRVDDLLTVLFEPGLSDWRLEQKGSAPPEPAFNCNTGCQRANPYQSGACDYQ